MARRLKTYQTSLGFFDEAIAAPSMKAALEAWGTKTNLFHQGVAKEVDDPEVIAATMRKPGVILRRPVGSNGPFKEHADLPTHLPRGHVKGRPGKRRAKVKKQPSRKIDDKTAREAALAFQREQKQRESERRKEGTRRWAWVLTNWPRLHGKKTQNLSNVNWLLRPGDSGPIHESGLGSLGYEDQSFPSGC